MPTNKGRIAPDNILRAGLDVCYTAAVFTRNGTCKDQLSTQQINELWEALHNVPYLLHHWRDEAEAELLSYLDGYNEIWPEPRLRARYEQFRDVGY